MLGEETECDALMCMMTGERLALDMGQDPKNLDGTTEDGETLDKLFEQTCATITSIFLYRSPS